MYLKHNIAYLAVLLSRFSQIKFLPFVTGKSNAEINKKILYCLQPFRVSQVIILNLQSAEIFVNINGRPTWNALQNVNK